MAYSKDFQKKLLRSMSLIRRFEEEAGRMYGLRKIGGFCHLYNGQEAIAVGVAAALDLSKDYVLTGYRDHGHALSERMDPRGVIGRTLRQGDRSSAEGWIDAHDEDKSTSSDATVIVGGQIPVATASPSPRRTISRRDGRVLETAPSIRAPSTRASTWHES
jgi:pyruvate dehydrogenase E1 component alpha subunit